MADSDFTSADYRDAVSRMVMPYGVDRASWLAGIRAGWDAALARPAGDAGAMRHAAAEVARRGAVVAYEQMADARNARRKTLTYADCMEAVGGSLSECQAMIRALPLPPATAVEEARRAFYEACRATHDALAARLAVVLNPPTQQFSGIVEDMAVEHCKRIERDAYARLLAAEAAAKGGARG